MEATAAVWLCCTGMARAGAEVTGLDKMAPGRRRALAVAVLLGAPVSASWAQKHLRMIRKEQRQIHKAALLDLGAGHGDEKKASAKKNVAVDAVFFARLSKIFAVCVPGLFTKEAMLIAAQGVLLFSRSVLTDLISLEEGACGGNLINQKMDRFFLHLTKFFAFSIPASFVNSGLKFFQKLIEVSFRERLSKHLHSRFMEGRCYYQASVMVGMSNIDQRLTEDVENFAASISELYNHTFKPLLDVILFTRSLSQSMGYKTQFFLYSYYVGVALVLKSISPPLSRMHAEEMGLSGNFRGAHHRVINHSEEIAYNDPPGGSTEQLILNGHLSKLLRYTSLNSFQKFLQQIADQFLVKYGASVVALLAYAVPFVMQTNDTSRERRAKQYIRNMRLLQNTSKGVGDLILVYKRVSRLAGHTSRVAELLEEIEDMRQPENREKNFYGARMPAICSDPKRTAEVLEGDNIQLDNVSIFSPDGTCLVKDLSFQLGSNCDSVLITGPNGSGKSSLIRVLAGLWPLAQGKIVKPAKGIFFLSQRPYLVTGSLRDQMIYPNPSSEVVSSASKSDTDTVRKASKCDNIIRDRDIKDALTKVELGYLLKRYSLDTIIDWGETLSGGEKQRIAMARLLCHKPRFAVLDECTSAVSADGERKLYETLKAEKISCLSIAHRPGVRDYHKYILAFDGSLQGSGWSLERSNKKK